MGTIGLRLLAAAGFVLVAAGAPALSSASFTATTNAPAGVSAAADWTPPTVAVSPPGTVSGSVVVTASAADQHSAIAAVTIQRSTGAGAWTALCTDATAPYSCAWDTTAVADGSHQLRAVASDTAGNNATSAAVTATVANAASVALAPLAEVVSGRVALGATVAAPGSASVDLRIQYARAGTTAWTDVPGCATTTRSVSCTWDTGQLADVYDVRARAVVGTTQAVLDVLEGVVVDNAAPSVSLTVPSGTLSGTVALTANADDVLSGVDTVAFEYAPLGSATWTGACSDGDDPFTCDWRTATLVDGSYAVRAVATDLAGNTTVTPSQQRTVNNTVASVSVNSPGSPVSGTVTVGADAASARGVKNVVLRWAPAGGSTWTTIYINGTLTSARVTVVVANNPLRAQDVQAVNVVGPGKVQPGDQLVLTYSAVVDPATVVTGWDGTGTRSMTVSLNQSGTKDSLGFTGANLGQVELFRNFTGKTVTFAAAVTHTVSTTGGVSRSVITVTLGSVSDPTALRAVTGTSNMVWTPSTAVRTPSGIGCSSAPATETGTKDRDF